MISLLDYGAGNVRSVRNAIKKMGYAVRDVAGPEDIGRAEKLIFPGVGCFGSAMERLREYGYLEPLIRRLKEDKPFLGICLGLQTLFEGSEESAGIPGLGIIPGQVRRFPDSSLAVPQMGWNGIRLAKPSPVFQDYKGEKLYFVHSYRAEIAPENKDWLLTTTTYGDDFISGIQKGNITAFQFHPEKSGAAGLSILKNFLAFQAGVNRACLWSGGEKGTCFAKRIIACLDVRCNDAGDLVVTKGDRYDVREEGEVRNLGKPVDLARRYYEEGADEIIFLNITGFRDFPLKDQPMLEVLRRTSENVFVPLTIGGGIREYTASDGVYYSALDVASEYFRSGADKISIGSDAVYAVEQYLEQGKKTGISAVEKIVNTYGSQAVVISIDPRRVYVFSPDKVDHHTIRTEFPGPGGEEYCWYQCTVKGGREGRNIEVCQLARICQELGVGEILLNCMDRDGTNTGFDLELVGMVKQALSIPVIASSGAGCPDHFLEVFERTGVEAALAAGIFHRREVAIKEVKRHLCSKGIETR
ncbi:MAG: imidazole glycerol phosphate synthase subunit HisF [Thermodesulfobacteriota bacterium]